MNRKGNLSHPLISRVIKIQPKDDIEQESDSLNLILLTLVTTEIY